MGVVCLKGWIHVHDLKYLRRRISRLSVTLSPGSKSHRLRHMSSKHRRNGVGSSIFKSYIYISLALNKGAMREGMPSKRMKKEK